MDKRFKTKWIEVESGCHEWIASKHSRGYGLFHTPRWYSRRKMDYAHRVSYYLHTGYKPTKDDCVCHKCDNPKCVNPLHLFIGTHQDNMVDMVSKGRNVSPKTKLTNTQVEEIIKLRKNGMMVKDIASLFNIDRGHASRVSRGLRSSNGKST